MRVIWVAMMLFGTAVPAYAQETPRERLFAGAVRTCDTLLDPFTGLDLEVSFTGDPDVLSVGVAAHPGLVQTLLATANDPPEPDAPASIGVVVAPDRDTLAATIVPPDPGAPVPLAVLAGPGGEVTAAFNDPPEPDAPAALAVEALGDDLTATFVPPIDPDAPAPVVVGVDRAGVVVVLADPPDPELSLSIIVDAASVDALQITDSNGQALMLVPATEGEPR